MSAVAETTEAKREASEEYLLASDAAVPGVAPLRIQESLELGLQNVLGVGVGYKVVAERATRQLCVRFYVRQKLARRKLSARLRLPKSIGGVPTDVVEGGPADFCAPRAECSLERKAPQRPVRGGISAAHGSVTFGTMGALCRSTKTSDDPGDWYALSNNHVFGNLNAAEPGDPLYQPSPGDAEAERAPFAEFARSVQLVEGEDASNRVDAALGRVFQRVPVDSRICSLGRIQGTLAPRVNLRVRKHGRTTATTRGVVDDVSHDTSVRGFKFVDQLRIRSATGRSFAGRGDSGSLVLTEAGNRAVGLVFATGVGDENFTLANPIKAVLECLEVELG